VTHVLSNWRRHIKGNIPLTYFIVPYTKIEFLVSLLALIAFFTDARMCEAKTIPVAGKKESKEASPKKGFRVF
jgi:hypothetical protein